MTTNGSFPRALLSRGKVKFFNEKKGFGFLLLDGSKKREVIFLAKHFAVPLEIERGQLDLVLVKKLNYDVGFRIPNADDEITFEMMWTHKGPMAKMWGFYEEWQRLNRRISGRLSPGSLLVRVKQVSAEKGIIHPQVLWEGELDKYLLKLNGGFASKICPNAVVEECRADGWRCVPHPSIWHPLSLSSQ